MGLDKIIFTTQNTDDSDKDLKPGEFRDSLNTIPYSDNSSGYRRKNIPGTQMISQFEVSTQAVCNGAYYHRPSNKSYFCFVDASLGHSIVEYNVTNDQNTLLIRNMSLNFDLRYPIHDMDIVGDLLYFNDGFNGQRKINIQRAKENLYTGANFSEIAIAQIRKQPIIPVVAIRDTDTLKTILNPSIRRGSFQFALRYVYLDNEATVLSPVSRLIPVSRNKDITNEFNRIKLTLLIDKDVKSFVSRVEIIVRYGNSGKWFIYDKVSPSSFVTVANDPVTGYNRFSYIYYFYNDKGGPTLSDEEALPLYQSFPRLTDTEELFQDRLFEIATKDSDYDLEEDNWDASIQTTNIIDDATLRGYVINKNARPESLLGLSRYSAGFVFGDKFGRRTAVSTKPGLSFETPENTTYPSFGNQLVNAVSSSIRVSVQGTGKPPVWADWVMAVRSNNLSYQWWHSTKCRVQFPKSIKKTTLEDPTAGYYIEDSYEYFDVNKRITDILSGAQSDFPAGFAPYIDITIPDNFPFTVDEKVLIRLAFNHPDNVMTYTAQWALSEGQIVEMFSNKIRIKNPVNNLMHWKELYVQSAVRYSGVNLNPYTYPVNAANQPLLNEEIFLHLSFFRPFDVQNEPIYFEIGEMTPILNAGLDNRSFPAVLPIHGDCYDQGYRFEEPGVGYAAGSHSLDFVFTDTEDRQLVMYPSMSALASEKGSAFKAAISTDQGKPNVAVDSTEEKHLGNVIRWTDKYIPNSKVNGLGVMREANKFTIPSERGDVFKLIGSGDNTLLAIHARTMTSLYINQRLLKSPSGQDTIVQSDEVVGAERPVSGELGTVNPESVISVDNYRVYGFDLNAAEPWRKSNDGATPLATLYKMKKWFKEKADELNLAKATDSSVDIKIIGGFDPYLETFWLTFKEVQYVKDGNTVIIPAQTIGFSESLKGFIGRIDIIPEAYLNFGNSLILVRNRKLWKHNVDKDNHNQFFDVQYTSNITVVGKMQDDVEKTFNWVGQSTNSPWRIISLTTPRGQRTDMHESIFLTRHDMYEVDVLRDVNTPAALIKPGQNPRLHGQEMYGHTCTITLQNSDKKEVILDAVYIGYSPISGHLIQFK